MFNVATVGSPHAISKELSDAVEELVGDRPGEQELFRLAGPNDLIQLVGDLPAWQKLLAAVGALYGGSIVTELGKKTAGAIWDNKDEWAQRVGTAAGKPLVRMYEAFKAARSRGLQPYAALPFGDRNIGLLLPTATPEETIIRILQFAKAAPKIDFMLTHMPRKTDRSTLGLHWSKRTFDDPCDAVRLSDDGHILLDATLTERDPRPGRSITMHITIPC